MASLNLAELYLNAWNTHDLAGLSDLFSNDGYYTDPVVKAKLSGAALANYVGDLIAAFPDLNFETVSMQQADDQTCTFEWIMRGTNAGSFNGLPPTGKEIALPGMDILRCKNGKITSVHGYFNSATMIEQLDLQISIQPKSLGPVNFGTSTYTTLGSKAQPGVFGVTQIKVSPEQQDELRTLTRAIIQEIVGMPGFISSTTTLSNDGHGITLTAWENMESAKQAVQGEAHKTAMQAMFAKHGLASGGWTSMLTDGKFNNRLLRCDECGELFSYTDIAICKCSATHSEGAYF
ncbi:MAG: steroid delta-isomerase-like uncharacterized protein [Parasphingorhabdus sp.]|jgi:steroid delta-isomerase-like uncharacterized protein